MNELFYEKYERSNTYEFDLINWEYKRPNRYGFVYVKNPNYYVDGDYREYLIRKPTTKERREIVINTIILCNGRTFRIADLAEELGVSDRTVQTILRQLEKEKLIQISPHYNKQGRQRGNAYKYIGPPCKFYGSGLTLKALSNPKLYVGFRDWAWREFEFRHDKTWHSIYGFCKLKYEKRIARRKYLKQHNLPLVVPENIKYLVLRCCYWKGETKELNTFYADKYNELYSKDSTIKLSLNPLNRCEKVKFYGYTLQIDFGGTESNPEIKISDEKTKEVLGNFSWFTENIIQKATEIDSKTTELFFILGDFITK